MNELFASGNTIDHTQESSVHFYVEDNNNSDSSSIKNFERFENFQTKVDSSSSSEEKKVNFMFRMGIGSSAHLGESTQLGVGIKPAKVPLIFSFISESYRKTPLKKRYSEPNDMFLNALNLIYTTTFPNFDRVQVYAGGGAGLLKLEKYERSDDPDWRQKPYAIEKGFLFNLQAGFHGQLFWKIGFYAEGKYLYAKKAESNINVIDVKSRAWMIGLSLNLGLFDSSPLKKGL
ncbi:hypothetical protein [Rhodohalobacter sulfatireducens]|uniref:Outer membrane protein beta-barrel domain-containing protein n=1 Tax=Rhodohalobacter sulfatireducens TaxID=2911366 RepID=A0ABS9KJ86_9BACT|nr:hypothetical protein [Rhodohalobacter sulfatireducens]MCG2590913.1 hypothetical protein [Rhodohalobacter sulfatireducens]